MSRIDDRDFVRRSLSTGASRNVVTGQAPTSGYMVGGMPNEKGRSFPEQQHPLAGFSEDHVRQHLDAIHGHYRDVTNVHQGSWAHGGNVFLDASQQFADRDAAIRAGAERGEKAIYDVGNDEDISLQQGDYSLAN